MVSRVEGTRYRCPWGQSPPAALPLSQNQTSALAAIPFSRILSSQDRFGAARGRNRRGGQPVVREERRGGNDCCRLEIDGREEFGGKLLGPINPSELCFPESEWVWVSTRCNGQSGLSGRVSPDSAPCAPALKYIRHKKAATASFEDLYKGSQKSLKYKPYKLLCKLLYQMWYLYKRLDNYWLRFELNQISLNYACYIYLPLQQPLLSIVSIMNLNCDKRVNENNSKMLRYIKS